ncbi:MAG: hypothetical protein GY878_05460 [Fuerstiella sp.]|nr:hypothetical protein [Fuerstiella sp.]
MPSCIDGFWVSDPVRNQDFNHVRDESDIIMYFFMEFVLEVPFGERSHRFGTDDNKATPICVETPPCTLTVSFAACAMEAE